MFRATPPTGAPDIAAIRARARILVVDDHAFPFEKLFDRDGYHVERWPRIKNVSQLTDGHYDLILLDIHGVGMNESPELQGLGVLQHVKESNPAQIVVVYSSQPQQLKHQDFLRLADQVFDKGSSYLEYKSAVDMHLTRRASLGYFIAKMNAELGDAAVYAPKAVPRAMRAVSRGSTQGLRRYLAKRQVDEITIDRVVAIINIAVTAMTIGGGS